MTRAALEPFLNKQVTLSWPDDDVAICSSCLKTLHRAVTIKNYNQPCRFCGTTGATVLRNRTKTAKGKLVALSTIEAGLDTGLWVCIAAVSNIVEDVL